jgi:transketolase
VQTRAAVRWAASAGRPVYLRVPRFKVPEVTPHDAPFEPRKAVVLRDGDDVTVIAIGSLTSRAVEAADRLREEGLSVRVLNTPFLDPIDEDAIIAAARETRGIVTAEEATTSGGLGAAVAATVVTHAPCPMRILGVPRVFAPTGDTAFLLEHFRLSADGIAAAVKDVLGHG